MQESSLSLSHCSIGEVKCRGKVPTIIVYKVFLCICRSRTQQLGYTLNSSRLHAVYFILPHYTLPVGHIIRHKLIFTSLNDHPKNDQSTQSPKGQVVIPPQGCEFPLMEIELIVDKGYLREPRLHRLQPVARRKIMKISW